jgi:hypothetical protein
LQGIDFLVDFLDAVFNFLEDGFKGIGDSFVRHFARLLGLLAKIKLGISGIIAK